jgi:hypothetical protein
LNHFVYVPLRRCMPADMPSRVVSIRRWKWFFIVQIAWTCQSKRRAARVSSRRKSRWSSDALNRFSRPVAWAVM